MNTPIEFETQRLRLRQWRAADREPFAALNASPLVMAYFPAPLNRDESDGLALRHVLRTHCSYRLSHNDWLSSRSGEPSGICRLVTGAHSGL
jgi:RimJ/RimL family protein N-acetyltransferase